MHAHSITQRIVGHCSYLFDVSYDCLPPVQNCFRVVKKLSSYVRQLRSFHSLCHDGEKFVDLVLIHRLETAVVGCTEDCTCYVPHDDLGYSLRDPLFDSDFPLGRRSFALLLVLISGSTVLPSMMVRLEAASTSLFLMWTVNL